MIEERACALTCDRCSARLALGLRGDGVRGRGLLDATNREIAAQLTESLLVVAALLGWSTTREPLPEGCDLCGRCQSTDERGT